MAHNEEEYCSKQIIAIQWCAANLQGCHSFVLPLEANQHYNQELYSVDDITTIAHLQHFMQKQPELIFQMIEHLCKDWDEGLKLACNIPFL